ncbi:MAG: hypothetical protein M3O32_03680 [Actinomycetota bacterium]|nr:hypothetical protein [Actinomycetota bacterium]
MADISIVGVRLVVEGSEESVAKLAAVDAAAKSMTGSLKEVGGQPVHDGLSRLIVTVESVDRGVKSAATSTGGLSSEMSKLDERLSSVSASMGRMSLLIGGLGAGGLVVGIGALGLGMSTFGLVAANSLDRARLSLEALLGSVSRGDALFKSLQTLQAGSTLGLPDLSTAGLTLLQGGYTDTSLLPTLRTLSTVAGTAPTAAQGTQFLQREAAVIAKIRSTGTISAADVTALQATNFPILPLLASLGLNPLQLGPSGTFNAQGLLGAVASGGGVFSPYQQASDAAAGGFGQQFTHLFTNVKTELATGVKPLGDTLARDLPGISTSLLHIIDQVMPKFDQFFSMLADKAPAALAKIGPFILGTMNWLQQNGPMLLTFVGDLGTVLQGIGQVGTALMPVLSLMLTGFHDFLSLPFAGTGVGTLLTILVGYKALSGLKDVLVGIGDGFRSMAAGEEAAKLASGAPGVPTPLAAEKGLVPVLKRAGAALLTVAGGSLAIGSTVDQAQHGVTPWGAVKTIGGSMLAGLGVGMLGGPFDEVTVPAGILYGLGAGVAQVIGAGAVHHLAPQQGAAPTVIHQTVNHNVTITTHDTTTMHQQMDQYYKDNGRRSAQGFAVVTGIGGIGNAS